jgi:hypothetical protein
LHAARPTRKKSGWHFANRLPTNKILALVAEIDHLLAEKPQRLGKEKSGLDTDASSHNPFLPLSLDAFLGVVDEHLAQIEFLVQPRTHYPIL